MLRLANKLTSYKLGAVDGEIGKCKDFYVDDQSWIVRYLVADTGNWLPGRQVLISPYALEAAHEDAMVIPVRLTRQQIEDSPSLDTHKPVSRQYELQYYPYFGWPAYWGGSDVWGNAAYPVPPIGAWTEQPVAVDRKDEDPHLRSVGDVSGYAIEGDDGEIGHVKDFVIDDETWNVRYLVVDTQNWWPGKKVLISTMWISSVSWPDSKVVLQMTRESISQSPEYSEDLLISRDYETHLHGHYNRQGYWPAKQA